jgi:uncharacterized protein (UPF0305 family)
MIFGITNSLFIVKWKKMSSEVLIYVQNLRRYFETNTEAQKYFETIGNEELFFNYISEMSQKNFDENDEPQLTLEQFEEVRRKITKFAGKKDEITGIFISLGDLGYVSLN